METAREEITEENGKEVSRKIIREPGKPVKKLFGISREVLDIIIKIIGLTTIAIAVFEYLDKVQDRINAERIRHEENLAATIKYQKEQQRLDSEFSLKQNQLATNQLQFQIAQENQRQNLEKQLTNSINQLQIQKANEIDKERRLLYMTSLSNASNDMEILTGKQYNGTDYLKAKDNLLYQLPAQIRIIGDEKLIATLDSFKNHLKAYELWGQILLFCDSVRPIPGQLHEKRTLLEAAKKYKSENSMSEDSSAYLTILIKATRLCYSIVQASNEILLLTQFNEEPYKEIYRTSEMLSDSLNKQFSNFKLYGGTSSIIYLEDNINNSAIKKLIQLQNPSKNLAPALPKLPYIDWLSLVQETLYTPHDMLILLNQIKNRFNSLVNEKIKFYQIR